MSRFALRRFRGPTSIIIGLIAAALFQASTHQDLPLGWSAARPPQECRPSLPADLDADRDGIADAEELELSRRYAPLVTLHADDQARPASVPWLLARIGRRPQGRARLRLGDYPEPTRRGSSLAEDWVTYVHVFPDRKGDGVLIQYWFFYPFNDGPLILDHEADWEHVTVQLDRSRRPLGLWAARHQDNAPGRFRPWRRLRKLDDTHPEVLAALGTHASYLDLAEVPWYDRAGRCDDLTGPCRHLRWRTWEAGGLQHLGESQAPLELFSMSHAGRWGLASVLPGRSAPFGPAFQRGWCAGGAVGCRMYGAY